MNTRRLFDTPVLVVDALGLPNEMKSTDGAGLLRIVEKLDRQYHEFRAKVPHRAMFVHRWGFWGFGDVREDARRPPDSGEGARSARCEFPHGAGVGRLAGHRQ